MNSNEKWRRFGRLIAEEGVNVQSGQCGLILANSEEQWLAEMIAKELRTRGAGEVRFLFRNREEDLTRLRSENPDELSAPPQRFQELFDWVVDQDGVFVRLTDLEEFPDIAPALAAHLKKGHGRAIKRLHEAIMGLAIQRCTVPSPNLRFAQLAYPELEDGPAVAAYSQMLFDACFLDEDDPAASLRKQDRYLADVAREVEAFRPVLARVQGPDTDLYFRLSLEAVFLAAYKNTTGGILTCPNIPGGEGFTYAMCHGVWGNWAPPSPTFLNGLLVEDIKLVLEEQRGVVEWDAKTSLQKAALTGFFELEDDDDDPLLLGGTRRVGEFAPLVDRQQPLTRYADLVLADIMPAEKRRPHGGIGSAYTACHKRGQRLDRAAQREVGLNHSSYHADFMLPWDLIELSSDNGSTWVTLTKDGNFEPRWLN